MLLAYATVSVIGYISQLSICSFFLTSIFCHYDSKKDWIFEEERYINIAYVNEDMNNILSLLFSLLICPLPGHPITLLSILLLLYLQVSIDEDMIVISNNSSLINCHPCSCINSLNFIFNKLERRLFLQFITNVLKISSRKTDKQRKDDKSVSCNSWPARLIHSREVSCAIWDSKRI